MALLQPHHGGNLAWAAAQAGCTPQEILDFSASINPLGPPLSVLGAIARQLGDIRAYPDPYATALRLALSDFHHIPADWILVGNGAAELLTWGCRSLSALEQTYVLSPGFKDYERALTAFDAKVYSHPIAFERLLGTSHSSLHSPPSPPKLGGSDPQSPPILGDLGGECNVFATFQVPSELQSPLDTLKEKLETIPREVSVGLLLNNPHNPTGQVFKKTTLSPLLERSQLVLVDEAFMDFLPSQDDYSLIPEIGQYPNLVILRSLTKFYSIPGLRLGYAIGHPDLLQKWQAWRDPWSVNALAIAAGIAAIQDHSFQAQTHQWLAAAKPQLFDGLVKLPGLAPIPGMANFLLVRCEYSVAQLQAKLLENHQILIRDCMSFVELGDRFFRVAVRTETENERLLQALAQSLE